MDLSKWKKGIMDTVGKYKYVVVILLIGLILMGIPGKKSDPETIPAVNNEQQQNTDLSQELTQVLKNIHGAGEVMVMLSEQEGERTIYQTDSTYSGRDGTTDSRTQTVLITDSNRNEEGLVYQRNPPTYLGAVVLAQGADDAAVKLAIVDAVSKITGLGADRISVLKMK